LNNYKIDISYDGSLFHGFQKQLNVRTVQSKIEESLKLIIGDYELNYAGRTDAGVHARSQVLSLKTIENLSPSFFNSLDSLLGSEIKIKKYQKVKTSFHPRFDAKSRVYKYFLHANDKGAPYNRDYRYLVKASIELRQLKTIEKIFLGKKNFKNFSKLRKGQDPYREILKSEWSKHNDYFIYTIEGDSFLHNMVRSIVGTQLAVLESKVTKKELKESLQQPIKTRFNFIVPAHGLYLWKIKY